MKTLSGRARRKLPSTLPSAQSKCVFVLTRLCVFFSGSISTQNPSLYTLYTVVAGVKRNFVLEVAVSCLH